MPEHHARDVGTIGSNGHPEAIGAGTADVVRLIVGETMVLALAGLAGRMGCGIFGGTILRTFIAGVSPTDALTLAVTAVLVCGSALTASALPAVRAALVNPLVALREM